MPETTTKFSRLMPSSGKMACTAARRATSPQPGHQRTSWSVWKSFLVSGGSVGGSGALLIGRLQRVHSRQLKVDSFQRKEDSSGADRPRNDRVRASAASG